MKVSESRDLDLDFEMHPVTGDVVILKGVDAVKRSIRNLIFLNKNEKPFHPEVGGNLRGLLFENFSDPFVRRDIRDTISWLVSRYEPRAKIKDILVKPSFGHNSLDVNIEFVILGDSYGLPATLPITLERLR